MAFVKRSYLVWWDTFGTCLDPRKRPHFHSNHPVWLGLAEACHTKTTHICVKSTKGVFENECYMFVHARLFACRILRVHWQWCSSQSVCVCEYLLGRTD